jgi:FkbM family methyltransferase
MNSFKMRPGTFDTGIFTCIHELNEYRLEPVIPQDAVLLDIGTHIGCFSYTALERGAGIVYGFEASPENFEIACENLRPFIENGRCVLVNAALWRSDREELPILHFSKASNEENTGGGNVLGSSGVFDIQSVSLDDYLESIDNPRIYMIKIDCEGSEWPILYTSQKLHLINRIHGEYHEFGGSYNPDTVVPAEARVQGHDRYTIEELTAFLESQGFAVESERSRDAAGNLVNLGHFFATRREH